MEEGVTADTIRCWKCRGSLADQPMPIGFRAECPHCRADLHVCVMCGFYDPQARTGCREAVAEAVRDKERANFCDSFRAASGFSCGQGDAAAGCRAELDRLFGSGGTGEGAGSSRVDAARKRLEDLFPPKGRGGK